MCESCSCDEGIFENCGHHKCLRKCMKLGAYEFNPDGCEKCPIKRKKRSLKNITTKLVLNLK
jgi:hypothetical protein